MTLFVPESIKVIGSDEGGNSVILCEMFVDDLADLPAQDAYTGYKLSMGCTATVINDNSRHRINSAGQWVQIAAGTSTYTRTEIDTLLSSIDTEIAALTKRCNVIVQGDVLNRSTFEFDISPYMADAERQRFKYGLLIGGVGPTQPLLYYIFINTNGTVTLTGILTTSRTLTATITNNKLTIKADNPLYGGLRFVWLD